MQANFRCCKKKRRHCDLSDFKGKFLNNVHTPPWKNIVFVDHCLSEHWDHKTVIKRLGFVERTSIDWRSFGIEVTDLIIKHWRIYGRGGA